MNCTEQVRDLTRDGCHGRQRVAPFYHATHTSSTWLLHFCHHSFWTFYLVVHQPDDVHTSTFHQTALGLVEQAFWRVPLFTEWIEAGSFEVILAGPSRHSTTGTFSSGTSGSRRISLILQHERIRSRIRLCHFCTFIDIVTETTTVSFRALPRWLSHCQQSPRILFSTLFCLLILDHVVSFIISISGAQIPIS